MLILKEKLRVPIAGFCLMAGVLVPGETTQKAWAEEETAFAIQQATETQKEVGKLVGQGNGQEGKQTRDQHTVHAPASPAALQDFDGMKEQLEAIKAKAQNFISQGKLMDMGNIRAACPSRLFTKDTSAEGTLAGDLHVSDTVRQGDKLPDCPSKDAPSPSLDKRADIRDTKGTGMLPTREQDQLFVFVSFSMPEMSLKTLAQEAERVSKPRTSARRVSSPKTSTPESSTQKYNAVLVMRGLYQDSFVKTAQKLQQLGIAVDINPELFETHNVTSVPTFVFLRNTHPATTQVSETQVSETQASTAQGSRTQAAYSLKGNVTLAFAIKKFKDQLAGNQLVGHQLAGNQLAVGHADDQQVKGTP
jgi:type-F conjugative transfer system pilin assembly protein TrbC